MKKTVLMRVHKDYRDQLKREKDQLGLKSIVEYTRILAGRSGQKKFIKVDMNPKKRSPAIVWI